MKITPLTLSAMTLVMASWLMPLHFLPWVSWHSEVLAFTAVLLLASGALTLRLWRARGSTVCIPLPPSALMWLALLVLVSVQCLAGYVTFFGDALVLGLYIALCAIAWLIGYATTQAGHSVEARSGAALEALAWTLLLGATASAVIAIVQAFDVWDWASWINRMPELRRPGGNIGQPNQLATLIIMGLASLILLYQRARLAHYAAGLIFLILGTALAATESRTGLLSLGVLALWCIAGHHYMSLRIGRRLVATCFLGILALYLSWPSVMSAIGLFAQDAQINAKPGLRLVVWPQLIEAIAMRPWTGWGLREVSAAHNTVVSNHAISEPYTYAHNVVLDLAIGAGVPLTVLIMIAASAWLWHRIKESRTIWAWYCAAAALPLAVHAMLEFPFAYAYFLAPVMFAFGSWEAMTGVRARTHIGGKAAALLVLGVSLIAVWSVIEYVEIEEDFRVVRFESMRVGKTPDDHERPKIRLLTQLDALLQAGRIEPSADMAPETLELARRAALRYPWPALQNRHALSLALNGQPDEAIRQLRVIRAQHGEKTYRAIREHWGALAQHKHSALKDINLP